MTDGKKQDFEILVVDDDKDLCHVIVDTMTEQGYRATFVETTEEALKKINLRTPDLLLLDLEVPAMGGFVLCQKIHENPATKRLPIIFLSVRDSDIDRKTAMGLGADFYISKPFRRSVLLKEVENLLTRKPAPDELIGPSATHDPVRATHGADVVRATHASPLQTPALAPRLKALASWSAAHKKYSIPSALAVTAMLVAGSIWFYHAVVTKVIAEKTGVDGAVSVNVIEAAFAPFQDVLSNIGTIKGGSEIELRFQTEGNIQHIFFGNGDAVKQGQAIAVLDQTQSKIKLDRAKQEYFRYEKLYALGGVSKDKLDEAKIQLDYAQSELNKTVIRANQDGIFGGRDASVGEFVTPQKRIGTVVSINNVVVNVGIIEKDIDKIYPDQKVIVTVETYPNVEFKGKVKTVDVIFTGGARTAEVEALLPNEGKLLLPGMYARTKIVVYEKDSVLAVPNDAVEKTEGGHQVYIVNAEGKAEARAVEISYVSLVNSVVASGLEGGEKIIIQKPQDLKAGSAVKIADVEKPVTEASIPDGMQGGPK